MGNVFRNLVLLYGLLLIIPFLSRLSIFSCIRGIVACITGFYNEIYFALI